MQFPLIKGSLWLRARPFKISRLLILCSEICPVQDYQLTVSAKTTLGSCVLSEDPLHCVLQEGSVGVIGACQIQYGSRVVRQLCVSLGYAQILSSDRLDVFELPKMRGQNTVVNLHRMWVWSRYLEKKRARNQVNALRESPSTGSINLPPLDRKLSSV